VKKRFPGPFGTVESIGTSIEEFSSGGEYERKEKDLDSGNAGADHAGRDADGVGEP
jgi:hypothetical protein